MLIEKISAEFVDGGSNLCKLKIPLTRRVRNVECCDIFIGDFDFIFFMDKSFLRYTSKRKFDLKDTKNLEVKFNSEQKLYTCDIPCIPEDSTKIAEDYRIPVEKGAKDECAGGDICRSQFDVLKLQRITETSQLQIDSRPPIPFDNQFAFGFGSTYKEESFSMETALTKVCRLSTPLQTSPIHRTFLREGDEVREFCRDQYKLNFMTLQVPEGHENPMSFTINFKDHQRTTNEKQLLNTLNSTKLDLVTEENQNEIDCGLISILLSICYDVRSTQNEATCESPWTRTVLSSTLSYFEVFDSFKSVVECFIRRSLTYPLYRNYDFSRRCVEDAIDVLYKGKEWICNQFLSTYDMFLNGNDNRELLNKYYISDYLRYISDYVEDDHLHILSRNLKNVLFDITKKGLRLGLTDIETELLKEIIEDMHSNQSGESEDVHSNQSGESEYLTDQSGWSDETDTDEDDEEWTDGEETTTSDDEDTNSVIENMT